MEKRVQEIEILGESFVLKVEEGPEYIESVLKAYEGWLDHVKEMTGIEDSFRLAILTGFILVDELQSAKQGLKDIKENVPPGMNKIQAMESGRLALEMIRDLDRSLEK